MQTTRAVLNDRCKKKTSTFHKTCTYDHSSPHFQSNTLHGYEFSHIKSSPDQLVFHKEEVRPTPISLPTPPASPEFYGTSLQKWYQKKPLFTLTAKGQVKRLEKYLQIQKTLEICKREYEFQIHTENMKKAFVDFEFRERQPFLYMNEDTCCTCDSPKKCDVNFLPIDDRTYSSSHFECCAFADEYDGEELEEDFHFNCRNSHFLPVEVRSIKTSCGSQLPYSAEYTSPEDSDNEQKVVPSEVIKEETCNLDDGIFKVVVRNKGSNKALPSKHVFKLFSNQNFDVDNKNVDGKDSTLNEFQLAHPGSGNEEKFGMSLNEFQLTHPGSGNEEKFGMSKINLGSFPFENIDGKSHDSYLKKKADSGTVKYLCSSATTRYTLSSNKKYTTQKQKYDVNKNEVYYK